MTKNLFSKLSSSLAVAIVVASGPVLAIGSDSEDEFATGPAPIILGAGMPVVEIKPVTEDLFKTQRVNKNEGTGASTTEDPAEGNTTDVAPIPSINLFENEHVAQARPIKNHWENS